MDSGVVMESEANFGERKMYSTFNFTGQCVGVPSFLKLLVDVDPKVMKTEALEASEDVQNAYLEWKTKWKSWKMGFCQFIQLEKEPTEDTLWFLLARRAAGVLPRDHEGADLVIPIFREARSEMGRSIRDASSSEKCEARRQTFSDVSRRRDEPKLCVSTGNVLRDKSPADTIRIYFSLQEEINIGDSRRFVYSYIDKSWQVEVDDDQSLKGNTQEPGSSHDQLLETYREDFENLYEHDRSDDEMKDLQRPSKKRKTNTKTSSSVTRYTNLEASSNGSQLRRKTQSRRHLLPFASGRWKNGRQLLEDRRIRPCRHRWLRN